MVTVLGMTKPFNYSLMTHEEQLLDIFLQVRQCMCDSVDQCICSGSGVNTVA